MSKESNLIVGDVWIHEAKEALRMILYCLDNRERIILGKHPKTRHSYFDLQQDWIGIYPNIQKEFPILAKEIRNRTLDYKKFLVYFSNDLIQEELKKRVEVLLNRDG